MDNQEHSAAKNLELNEDCAVWRQILDVARHAPSPHNVQPWRVRLLSSTRAKLYIDGTRTLPNEDLTGSFLLSAMGMFLEAMELVAAEHKLRVDAELVQSAEWLAEKISDKAEKGLIHFADLWLSSEPEAAVQYTADVFRSRRTCRISLRPEPVPPDAVAILQQLALEWGHTYTQITDTRSIEEVLQQNIDAVFHDMNVAAYRDEITEWFRFTDKSAEARKDGLDWRCMNLSRLEFWMSARMGKMLLFGPTRAFFKRRYRRQLGCVPAIGVLSVDFFDVANAVSSGRFLMQFWLEITRLGLYLHPYGNLVTNKGAAAWFERETGVKNSWLIFKLGYSDTPPSSFRRSVDDILITSGGAV